MFPLCALALTMSGLCASAQVLQYADGDLILDFSESDYSDVEVDIGNVTSLINAAKSNGGTVTLSGSDYNISSQLLGTFPGVDSLSFSVFGLQNNASGTYLAGTIFLTQAQSGAGANSAPRDLTGGSQQNLVGTVQSIVGVGADTAGLLPWSKGNAANSTDNTAKVAIIPTAGLAAVNSYTTIGPAGWAAANISPQNTTSATFDSDGGGIISDLFEYDPVGKGPNGNPNYTEYLGYFTFNSDGSLTFSLPTPPSTVITSISKTGASVTVNFNTVVGVNYSLFYTTNLNIARSSWVSNAIPPLAGTGSTGSLTDTTATDTARFYKVKSSF